MNALPKGDGLNAITSVSIIFLNGLLRICIAYFLRILYLIARMVVNWKRITYKAQHIDTKKTPEVSGVLNFG